MTSYSNGWGHLIATIAICGMCAFLLFFGKIQTDLFAAIIGPVVTFWFMSGAVNRFNNSGGTNVSSQSIQTGVDTTSSISGSSNSSFQSRSS